MNAEPLVTIGLPGRTDRGVVTTSEIDALLRGGSPVAMGVSGGKDSVVAAFETCAHLDAIGHTGPRKLVHSDLGSVEWKDSLPTCERLAHRLGLELIVVRRAAGGMMERWETRWERNVERYARLSCVKLILPWSTPSMRFCTSELKTAVICRELVRRFPGQTIVSVSGIRRSESPKRNKSPIAKVQKKLTSVTHRTSGVDWNPILDYQTTDVFACMAARGFAPHEAYTAYDMSRVSCVFCIMQNEADQRNATTCPDNHDIYRTQVGLEVRSTFAFQGDRWLGDVAPHLLDQTTRDALEDAKRRAARRTEIESRIPDPLLYERGWPKVMPTFVEAVMLAEVRVAIGALVGIDVDCTTPEAVIARYAELMAENERRNASKSARDDEEEDD